MRLAAAFFVLMTAAPVFAQTPAPAPGPAGVDGDYLRRTEQIIRRAVDAVPNPDALTDQQKIDAAARIARDAPAAANAPISAPKAMPRLPPLNGISAAAAPPPNLLQGAQASEDRGIYLFVSDSLSDDVLRAAMEVANETGATVVFRGVQRGMSIHKSFARAYLIAKKFDPVPGINIDPTPFTRFGVASVPAVVVYEGNEYVKVSGSLSVDYAKRRFRDGQFGDAGARGPTSDIVEPDLIEEMQDRVGRIDWEAKKQGAIARYWNNVRFHKLPPAQANAVRYFDPTVINRDDIRDQNGNLVAPAGAAINPLDVVAFNKTIVVFNATNKDQLAFAKRVSDGEIAKGRGVILLMSEIDLSRPWEAVAEYNRAVFPNRAFLLDELVAARFGIVSVPSIVRADGRRFRIEELVLPKGDAE